jgi:hypothetical protein
MSSAKRKDVDTNELGPSSKNKKSKVKAITSTTTNSLKPKSHQEDKKQNKGVI